MTAAAWKGRLTMAAASFAITAAFVLTGTGAFLAAASALRIEAHAATDDDKDYTIGDAWWDLDSETGTVRCRWEKAESSTAYKLLIYKGYSSRVIRNWGKVSGGSFDATSYIANNGTGSYYFAVYSVNGGEETMVESEELEIDYDTLKTIKNRIKTVEAEAESGKLGWEYQLDGTWFYYKSGGIKAKNEWIDDGGQRYHFSSKGVMQTGWQQISGKWYYFDKKNGNLYVNTTTPDGYPVNESGEYVAQGQSVSASGTRTSPPVMTKLTRAAISVSEKSVEPGKLSTTTFTAGTGFTIENITYSQPQEQWSAGSGVQVSMLLKAGNNYEFTSSTVFSCRGCDVQVTSRSSTSARLTFYYIPKLTLETPSNLYINEATVLNWKKVDHASRYKIAIYQGKTQLHAEIISTNYYDLGGYFEYDNTSSDLDPVNVKLYAMGSDASTKYYLTSKAVEITNLDEWALANTTDGELRYTSGSLSMRDEDGNRVKGWQYMLGAWYYFGNNGTAVGPGWKQIENDWYYFDADHRMVTGWIEDGGYQYYLSDGSQGTMGAMVKGSFTDTAGVTYNLNDGSVAGIPEGARY